ncbi:MAG: RagB/SusD family nutrient uptake outer membrane protein [Candidatus Pseudobacter hemicellulosilyticus]|uniref:RagB/SusD family nutrient uptake outer membrane protein n=1 Tax=Candidatus Pseudobacter hemicellulosilyticus TaxID=3121375 RepID=A0AAJ5WUJ8_9BACT|nr:MAG: RagB/SusD family nutrient uptake outer membrane protein [Pseudobacter sp.]
MKKTFQLIILAGALLMTGCKKYLDQVPDDRITIEQVFKKKANSEEYLANVYSHVPDESDQWAITPWGTNSDEMEATWTKYDTYQLNIGNISAGNALFDNWGYFYKGIRSATYFINHIDGNTEILAMDGQGLIDQYKAEARFLRAYFYFLLMRQYGPVALLPETEVAADASGAAIQFPRRPFDECVNYVVSELDKAAAVLPLVPSSYGQPSDLESGRITVGIAKAVKARLLLYAASPLYNGNTEMASLKNQDGTQLFNQQYDAQKWKRAADASKEIIDMGLYSLYKDASNDPIKSYQGVFLQSWNSEQIFNRKSNGLGNWDVHCMPRQAGGWNGICITQEQVDAYFMSDGKLIANSALYKESGFTTVNGVSVSNMYVSREPRFYASVTYHNSMFQGGKMTKSEAISFFVNGPNGKNGHATDWSKTGYLIRKNVAPQTNAGSGGNGNKVARPICLYRLAEVYLNYAEALNETDPTNPDIAHYLNLIRSRSGVPEYGSADLPVPASQEAMRNAIRAERRVELAFETHRWFDIRRWKIASQVMGSMHGMDINKNDNSFFTRVVISEHKFRAPASYWFPISQYDMDRSRLVVQNLGW